VAEPSMLRSWKWYKTG